MSRIVTERKQKVLRHIYDIRELKGDPAVKKHNLPVWVDDRQAAQGLVRERILEHDPHNNDKDCYRAGPKFGQGLRKYGIMGELAA